MPTGILGPKNLDSLHPCQNKLPLQQCISLMVSGHKMASRDVTRARTSRTLEDVTKFIWASIWIWLSYPLLWAYLWNRKVDFAHFLQDNCYGGVDYVITNSAQLVQYLSCEKIFSFPWQPIGIFKFRFREVFFVPLQDLHAEFGAHKSKTRGGVSTQTNTQTLLKFE